MLHLETPTTNRSPRLPGDSHIWVMVLGDLLIFTGYFIIYIVYRTLNADEFLAAQQHLSVNIGVTNTVVLLTSSWLIARSVFATRAGNYASAIRFVYAAAAGGAVFIILKGYEWAVKIGAGNTTNAAGEGTSDSFFTFYYVITGVHLVHVLIGLIALGALVRELKNPSRRRTTMVESGALYWHMVDLLWVVIFGLLYVMR